jgi:HCOMODA/2-hydroxy-3-carboxy-muconic semialdehyde decarboxylase
MVFSCGPCHRHPAIANAPADRGGALPTGPASAGLVEPALINDLAAASRILARLGVVDAFGHVSIRHPAAADRFLMSRALAPALVRPDDILELDLAGTVVGGDDRASFLERFIHGEIYRARADVTSVVHTHSPSLIPFGLVATPMRAMFHNAAFLAGGVPVFDIADKFGATDMLVSDPAKGAALASVLADRPVVLMRGHGAVAVGPSLQVAVFRAVYAEVNARIQHQAQAYGGPIAALSREEGALADLINAGAALRAWTLWTTTLDR